MRTQIHFDTLHLDNGDINDELLSALSLAWLLSRRAFVPSAFVRPNT